MTTIHDSVSEHSSGRKSAGDHSTGASGSSGRASTASSEQADHLIRFSRDFSEAASSSAPSSLALESLSSASSFQSLASTISSKSSSGICADSAPGSPDKTGFDQSYVNADIPDLDDLISACANINLNVTAAAEDAAESHDTSADLSQDQTFTSAADDTIADETRIVGNLADESIQTFKTCLASELTQISKVESSSSDVFKAPLPINQTSVIPYVTFEQSVLRHYKSELSGGAEFTSSLSSFQIPDPPAARLCYSLTPCVEIDVLNTPSTKSEVPGDASFVSARSELVSSTSSSPNEDKEEQNSTELSLSDVNSEQGLTLDSTIILNPGAADENVCFAQIPEKLNLTVAKDATIEISSSPLPEKESNQVDTKIESAALASNNITNIVEKEPLIPTDRQVIVQESNVLNKTQDIVQEPNVLNQTQDIVQEFNILNKTQDIVQENVLNKTQDIVQENVLNKTQDIIQENVLNKNEVIVKNENILNKTQDIIGDKTPISESKVIVKEENNLNKTEVIVQNNTQVFSEVNVFPQKQEEIPKHFSDILIPEAQSLKLKSETLVPNLIVEKEIEKPINKLSIQEPRSRIEKEKPVLGEIKSPSRPESTRETFEENSNSINTEVIASTPLSTKNLNIKEKAPTPKRKSALFNSEVVSPKPHSPQITIKSVETLNNIGVIKDHRINLDQTVPVNKTLDNLEAIQPLLEHSINLPPQEPEYEAFKPQQQSTTLPFSEHCDFEALQQAALSVAKDIDASLENIEESEQFVSATAELFEDPSALDFLNQLGSQSSRRAERYDSLYMKFDPLAQKLSMLPQKNLLTSPLLDEEEVKETKVDTPVANMGTPKKNPALAAIDRLLFYSPSTTPTSTESEVAEAKQKKEEVEKPAPQTVPFVDEKMAKELELVRSTVLQLEAELEKQKHEHKEQLEKQKVAFEEKVSHMQTKFSQMQTQLMQEVKCKDQMTVVVEEYEKSISRLIAEREKDRTSFETEKVKLQEELQVANQHLSNTEAAFSDVHSKYERLKNVVSAYKSNETVLKESIAENQETIKTLENRYEQLKSHAMAQLEKANLELSAIRKHNEAETVKLKALVRRAELKSKSLEETVEQKMKENKELTQIIDEMIARVD